MNSAHLIRTGTALSACYRGQPDLLERHHSLRALELLAGAAGRRRGLLAAMPRAARREVRAAVRSAILATDMRGHERYLTAASLVSTACGGGGGVGCRHPSGEAGTCAFGRAVMMGSEAQGGPRRRGEAAAVAGRSGAVEVDSAALLRVQVLLKCADISNAFRPFPVSVGWAVCFNEELHCQGDRERALGLAVGQECDRGANLLVVLQREFMDTVVAPFLDAVVAALPELEPRAAMLAENRGRWESFTDTIPATTLARAGRQGSQGHRFWNATSANSE